MNNEVLIDSIKRLGIDNAVASGRNDIVIGERKVSGSAYRLSIGKKDGSGRKALHHGTMLLNIDLDAVEKYLSPNKLKLKSKGIESVRARVMNLSEIVPDISHE